jgi:hypothetical protein
LLAFSLIPVLIASRTPRAQNKNTLLGYFILRLEKGFEQVGSLPAGRQAPLSADFTLRIDKKSSDIR